MIHIDSEMSKSADYPCRYAHTFRETERREKKETDQINAHKEIAGSLDDFSSTLAIISSI